MQKTTAPSGNVITSAALVAGTTIGAGILALPAVTLPAGVVPSTLALMGVWLYMLISGLLIAEANMQVMAERDCLNVGLLATVQARLGQRGVIVAGLLYIFIHYAMLVAYVARGGDLLVAAVTGVEKGLGLTVAIPLWSGHLGFVLLFGALLYGVSERWIGRINSVLLAVVIVTFVGLLGLTASNVDPSRWAQQNWGAMSGAIPVVVVAFVYHNVVPVVTTQLAGDARRVRWAIVLGAIVPLVMFVVWNAVILGCVDGGSSGEGSLLDPIEVLRQGRAHPALGGLVGIFSEFAIATSFIGFVYGLLNVLIDIEAFIDRDRTEDTELGRTSVSPAITMVPKTERKMLRYALVLLPPLALSVTSPNVFFSAIEFAGAFGNSILFGIIPAVMAWKVRSPSTDPSTTVVPGGRWLLTVMIGLAIAIIVQNALIKGGLV